MVVRDDLHAACIADSGHGVPIHAGEMVAYPVHPLIAMVTSSDSLLHIPPRKNVFETITVLGKSLDVKPQFLGVEGGDWLL